ncbi:MAG: transposase [Nanoarchaeota archaeon]|nr:transposase [Nanoarchaeota archaeon]MBU1974219.1 transposase [Nanoarchaeota archaeon]
MQRQSTSPHPDWALKFRKPGTELRLIKGKYYLYEYKTIYDKLLKRPKKISGKLLGRITEEDGFLESDKNKLRKNNLSKVGQIREFGISNFIISHFGEFYCQLQKIFPEYWENITMLTYCRLVFQSPIKNMPYHIEQSWLAEQWAIKTISDKTISNLLREIGKQRDRAIAYMKAFIYEGQYFLADTTHILSKSKNIQLSKKGYNNQHEYEPQINLMYLYSAQSRMPVFYRLHAGNIREVKAFKLTITESGLKNAIIIGDKGFYSKENLEALRSEGLFYIVPLKRDSRLINYDKLEDNSLKAKDNYFEYEKRFIWYEEQNLEIPDKVTLFLDESLRVKEENDYLRRIKTHPEEYSKDEFMKTRNRLGTIAIITNLSETQADELFIIYKSRMAIEEMFDSMKNVLDADSTYMQNEEALQGWMFINHIAIQWYQQIYLLLKENKLNSKYSVRDFLLFLRDIRKVKVNDIWLDAEKTKASQKLLQRLNLA